ncbi:unnamed protein product [Cylicocyclus nassatus]|uniref:Uncharacterized protein n=1 Tax=Cylicocyclus nassatus TaxID=53992 RepID=A0AA36M8P9_CYLNA|nr:unnamed protein product [Cylicocyclus nassatus]
MHAIQTHARTDRNVRKIFGRDSNSFQFVQILVTQTSASQQTCTCSGKSDGKSCRLYNGKVVCICDKDLYRNGIAKQFRLLCPGWKLKYNKSLHCQLHKNVMGGWWSSYHENCYMTWITYHDHKHLPASVLVRLFEYREVDMCLENMRKRLRICAISLITP